jgi:iron transport multicopper oxidase
MPDMIADYMSPSNTNGDFDSPDSFLFNDTNKPFDLKFEKGKKYLLRIVNTAAVACGQFHIEGYKLSVVEIDGVQMVPEDADTIIICAGQSYGVVVQGQSNPKGAANWIAQMRTDMLTRPAPSVKARTVIGRLVYTIASLIGSIIGGLLTTLVNILTLNWTPAPVGGGTLNDFTMKPLDGQRLLTPVDNKIELTTNQTYFEGIGTRTPLNAQPWVSPKVPTLYTALTTGSTDAATYGPGVNPWIVKSGQVVQIHMQNPHQYPHPMHLHGHVFQVVATGSGTWNGNEASMPSVPSRLIILVCGSSIAISIFISLVVWPLLLLSRQICWQGVYLLLERACAVLVITSRVVIVLVAQEAFRRVMPRVSAIPCITRRIWITVLTSARVKKE